MQTKNLFPLIIDQDGNVDDVIAITLQLLHAPKMIKAITINPADCFAKPTAWVSTQLQHFLLSHANIPIGISTDEGTNPFPDKWREISWRLARMSLWNKREQDLTNFSIEHFPSAVDLIIQTLQTSPTPVNILITGPCTNMAEVLQNQPAIKNKINRLFIMGGAINITGNVEESDHDGSAEWNIYNNPQAFHAILTSGLSTTLVPLEATQHAPIRNDLIMHLKDHSHLPAYKLVYETLQTIKSSIDTGEYMLWDALTSAAIINSDVIETKSMKINVKLDGPSMGKTFEDTNGFEINVAISANQDLFEQTILKILEKS